MSAAPDVNRWARHRELNEALFEVCQWGLPEEIASLLDQGAAIEATDPRGQTPLMIAAEYNRQDNVQLLLSRGASTSARTPYLATPLMIAASKGPECLPLILAASSKEDVKARDQAGKSALEYACYPDCKHKALGTVSALLAAGLSPTVPSRDSSCLHEAIWSGAARVVRLLLAAGATALLEVKNHRGRTPILDAAASYLDRRLEIMKIFAEEYNADCNAADPEGRTALSYVCRDRPRQCDSNNTVKVVLCLIACGASTSAPSPAGHHFHSLDEAVLAHLEPDLSFALRWSFSWKLPRRVL
jgi:ankyrin repeat protein